MSAMTPPEELARWLETADIDSDCTQDFRKLNETAAFIRQQAEQIAKQQRMLEDFTKFICKEVPTEKVVIFGHDLLKAAMSAQTEEASK